MLKKITIALLLFPSLAFGQANIIKPDIIPTFRVVKNYIKNPSALVNVNGITATNATRSRTTSTNNKPDAVSSTVCTTSSQGGYCEWETNTINDGDLVGDCAATLQYKNNATLHKVEVFDGTNVVAQSEVLKNVTNFTDVTVNYPCGATRTVRFTQTEAGTAGAVAVGRVTWGKQNNVGFGNVDSDWTAYTPVWTANSSNPALVNGTIQGYWRRNGDSADVRIWLKSGSSTTYGTGGYNFSLPSGLVIDTTKIQAVGTTTEAAIGSAIGFDTSVADRFSGTVNIQSTTTVGVSGDQGSLDGYWDNDAPFTPASGDEYGLTFTVPIVGWTSTTGGVRSEQTNYPWTSFTPSTVGSQGFGTLAAESCFHKRDGQYLLIECKITAGTAAASEARITLPNSLTVSAAVVPSIRLAEGFWIRDNSSATTVKRGTILMNGGDNYIAFGRDDYTTGASPLSKGNGSTIFSSSDVISFYAKVPITGWNESQKVPILLGSVTSNNTSGSERIERANVSISAGSTCTINSQSGSWISGASATSSQCTLTFANAFSAAPTCVGIFGGSNDRFVNQVSVSTTNFVFEIWDVSGAGAATNATGANLICMGPR